MSRPRVDARHGAVTRALRRPTCPCPDCRAVRAARSRSARHATDLGMLLADCWCGTDQILVPQADVLACRTDTCGRPHCKED